MKENAKPDWGDGPERDELRAMLRHWPAPQAPPEIEDALRREFRRRRSRSRPALWISLAAAATLLVAWQVRRGDQPSRPASPRAPVAAAPSPAPRHLTAEPDRVPGSRSAAAETGRARRRPSPAPKEPEVVVEPAQAELLAELSRKMWGKRQAVPGTTIPEMPEGDVPGYREEWETVAGEWPLVQQSVPIGGR
jgi:hypothetical protein